MELVFPGPGTKYCYGRNSPFIPEWFASFEAQLLLYDGIDTVDFLSGDTWEQASFQLAWPNSSLPAQQKQAGMNPGWGS